MRTSSKIKKTCTLLEGTWRWTYSALRYFFSANCFSAKIFSDKKFFPAKIFIGQHFCSAKFFLTISFLAKLFFLAKFFGGQNYFWCNFCPRNPPLKFGQNRNLEPLEKFLGGWWVSKPILVISLSLSLGWSIFSKKNHMNHPDIQLTHHTIVLQEINRLLCGNTSLVVPGPLACRHTACKIQYGCKGTQNNKEKRREKKRK